MRSERNADDGAAMDVATERPADGSTDGRADGTTHAESPVDDVADDTAAVESRTDDAVDGTARAESPAADAADGRSDSAAETETSVDERPDAEASDAEPSDPEAAAEAAARPSPGERRRAERDERRTARTRTGGEVEEPTVHLRVYRYDPEVAAKAEPRFDDFHVPWRPGRTVLDALIHARDHYDPSLTFRHSCRQAVCGSDALFINGRQRLACKTQAADLDEPITVEPLPHREVLKDLVVDMQHFYDQMHAVEPYFDPDEAPPGEMEEYRQSRANREKIKMATRCIWCGACASACNIVAGDEQFLGPAAINQAYRFAMDEREGEARKRERIELVGQEHGVWRCQTMFSCTEVCPKDIPLTEHIQELKREGVKRNLRFW